MGNWQNWHGFWQMPWSMDGGWFAGGGFVVFVLLLAWSLVWKGLALWKAARNGSAGWFVALLVLNTLGVLDILYIYVFSKKHRKVE